MPFNDVLDILIRPIIALRPVFPDQINSHYTRSLAESEFNKLFSTFLLLRISITFIACSMEVCLIYFMKLLSVLLPLIFMIANAGTPSLYIFEAADLLAVCELISSYLGVLIISLTPFSLFDTSISWLMPANFDTVLICL